MIRIIRRHLAVVLALPACTLVFLADVLIRQDAAVWLGYLATVAVAAWFSSRRFIYILAALSTVLVGLGFFLSPPAPGPSISLADRTGATVLIWGAAMLIDNRRQLLQRVAHQAEGLAAANEQLQQQAGQLRARAQELCQANESLLSLSARLVAVQENERKAFSRELHDETGQLLTALTVRLGVLQNSWQRGESPVDGCEQLTRIANQLTEGLHRLAINLRPASLDRSGLLAAVEQYIASYGATYNLKVDLVAHGLEDARLAPEIETTLYRIVQEALTNVARHAHAGQVAVLLERRPDAVTAIIEDDGAGFDVDEATRSGRLGLAGMSERAELSGGRLTIESRPGAGATVYVEIPLPARPLSAASSPLQQVS